MFTRSRAGPSHQLGDQGGACGCAPSPPQLISCATMMPMVTASWKLAVAAGVARKAADMLQRFTSPTCFENFYTAATLWYTLAHRSIRCTLPLSEWQTAPPQHIEPATVFEGRHLCGGRAAGVRGFPGRRPCTAKLMGILPQQHTCEACTAWARALQTHTPSPSRLGEVQRHDLVGKAHSKAQEQTGSEAREAGRGG